MALRGMTAEYTAYHPAIHLALVAADAFATLPCGLAVGCMMKIK